MTNHIQLNPPPLPKEPIPARNDIITNPHHQDVSDASKVVKTNVKDDYNQNQPQEQNFDFNSQSIRQRVLKLLLNNESATQAVKRLLLGNEALFNTNALDSAKWSQFLEQFFLSAEEMPTYLKEQLSNHSLFQGSFFDFLRNILSKYGNNPAIKNSLLNVLKTMELFQNRQNTSAFLIHNLNNLLPFLNADNQRSILDAINYLQQNMLNDTALPNDLQRSIMDALSQTASKNRDNSNLRNMIMQAIHNLSRLDNSDKASLLRSIENFTTTLQQYSKLTVEQKDALMASVQHQLNNAEATNHSATDRILSALDFGLSGSNPLSMQLASSGILSALLLNHSVLLPLIYGFIPLKLDNTYLFSELWAHVEDDEDTSNGKDHKNDYSEKKKTVVFFTMESSVFGYMQGTLESRQKNIDLQLEAPDAAVKILNTMKEHLAPTIEELGYKLNQVDIVPLEVRKHFIDVFGKKILKEASLNVRV